MYQTFTTELNHPSGKENKNYKTWMFPRIILGSYSPSFQRTSLSRRAALRSPAWDRTRISHLPATFGRHEELCFFLSLVKGVWKSTGWWLISTHLKKYAPENGCIHLPQVLGENNKCLSCHHLVKLRELYFFLWNTSAFQTGAKFSTPC